MWNTQSIMRPMGGPTSSNSPLPSNAITPTLNSSAAINTTSNQPPASSASTSSSQQPAAGEKAICKFFLNGGCLREPCYFLHELPDDRHLDVNGLGFIINANVHNAQKTTQSSSNNTNTVGGALNSGTTTIGGGNNNSTLPYQHLTGISTNNTIAPNHLSATLSNAAPIGSNSLLSSFHLSTTTTQPIGTSSGGGASLLLPSSSNTNPINFQNTSANASTSPSSAVPTSTSYLSRHANKGPSGFLNFQQHHNFSNSIGNNNNTSNNSNSSNIPSNLNLLHLQGNNTNSQRTTTTTTVQHNANKVIPRYRPVDGCAPLPNNLPPALAVLLEYPAADVHKILCQTLMQPKVESFLRF